MSRSLLVRRVAVAVLLVISVSCDAGGEGAVPDDSGLTAWSPTQQEWRSGLTIGGLPDEFDLDTNVGNEAAIQHRFVAADGTQLEVARILEPDRFPTIGEPLETFEGVTYFEGSSDSPQMVFFETQGVRIEVTSPDLPVADLLTIAKSVAYDPSQDEVGP